MGTRHLICVIHDKEFKLAQYGQFDGYPSGSGIKVLNFLREEFEKEQFIKNLDKLEEYTLEKKKEVYSQLNIKGDKEDYIVMSEYDKLKTSYPELHRYTSAEVLSLIQNGNCRFKEMVLRFAKDSLFCEWVYLINLDTDAFEVYVGYVQKQPPKENIFGNEKNEAGYYPCKLVKSYSITELPTREKFIEDLDSREEE